MTSKWPCTRTRASSTDAPPWTFRLEGPSPRYESQHPSWLLIYSQYLDQRSLKYPLFPSGTLFARTWEDVIAQLRTRHSGDATVAVYPYCAIQHIEAGLDEAG